MSDRTQSAFDRNEGVAPPPPMGSGGNGMMPTRAQMKPLTEVKSIREALGHPEMVKRFQQAVPGHLSPQRMLRVMALAVQKTPRLLECDVMSLLGAMLALASLGLEPNTPMGLAYLIPYAKRRKNEGTGKWEDDGYDIQVIIGYRGYIDLARRAGTLVSIHADVVYKGDEFSFEYGSRAHLRHVPTGTREDREPIWAYAHVRLTDGEAFEVWPYAQVLKIRDNSQGYQSALRYRQQNQKGFAAQPWVAHEHPMAAKTMVRSVAKMLPMSIELANAAALDSMSEGGKVNLRALSTMPADHLPDMAMLGYEDAFPNFDLGGFNPQYAGAEMEEAEAEQGQPKQQPTPADKGPGRSEARAKSKQERKASEPAAETNKSESEQTERKPATRDEAWAGVEADQAAGAAQDDGGARFEARVLDYLGNPTDRGAFIFDPVAYARALTAYIAKLAPENREATIDHNGHYIEAAEAISEEASKLLDEGLSPKDEAEADGGAPTDPQTADAPRSLVVKLERDGKNAPNFRKLLTDCAADLEHTEDADLTRWLVENAAYWEAEKVPSSTRSVLNRQFEARRSPDWKPANPAADEEAKALAERARQDVRATSLLEEIAKISSAAECQEFDGQAAMAAIYRALVSAGRTDLTERLSAAFNAKAEEFGYVRP